MASYMDQRYRGEINIGVPESVPESRNTISDLTAMNMNTEGKKHHPEFIQRQHPTINRLWALGRSPSQAIPIRLIFSAHHSQRYGNRNIPVPRCNANFKWELHEPNRGLRNCDVPL